MSDHPTYADVLLSAVNAFDYAGIDTPQMDARLLLSHAAGISHVELISQMHDPVRQEIQDCFADYVARRLSFEPVHRILGAREFYGREFEIGLDSLVPRPDTETLIDVVLQRLNGTSKALRILDLGTGSGALAVTLACEIKTSDVVAVDISTSALNDCAANAKAHGVESRLSTLQSDMFENVEGMFDLIVSNPPYIPTKDIEELAPEVRHHDPARALDGGEDGLDFYHLILKQAKDYLSVGGLLAMEFGIGQSGQIKGLAGNCGWSDIHIHDDLGGIPRVISASP